MWAESLPFSSNCRGKHARVVCCTIKSVPKSSVFLCRLSLRVGGRAAPSSSMKFNTLSFCLSHRVFSFYLFFPWQNDICVLRKGWVLKTLSLPSWTALECVSGSCDSLVLWSACTWCPAVCFISCIRRCMPCRKFINCRKEWVDCSCLIGLSSWLKSPLPLPLLHSTYPLPLSELTVCKHKELLWGSVKISVQKISV